MCLSTFNSIHSFHNYLLFLIYVYFSQLTSPTNTIHIYSSLLIIIIFTDSYPHFTPFTFHSQLSNKSNHHSSFTLNFFTAPSSSPLSKFQFHSLSLSLASSSSPSLRFLLGQRRWRLAVEGDLQWLGTARTHTKIGLALGTYNGVSS